jgi:hypothetical protein
MQKLVSAKLPPDNNIADVIDSMNLKHVLGQIQADDSDLLESHDTVPSLSCAE